MGETERTKFLNNFVSLIFIQLIHVVLWSVISLTADKFARDYQVFSIHLGI